VGPEIFLKIKVEPGSKKFENYCSKTTISTVSNLHTYLQIYM